MKKKQIIIGAFIIAMLVITLASCSSSKKTCPAYSQKTVETEQNS
jgi:hypothetical protein